MLYRAFFILLTLALTACSTQQRITPTEDDRRDAITHFTLQGKLGVKAPDNSGSANITWQQLAGQYDIELSGPLGMKRTQIIGNGHSVELRQGDQVARAATAEALIKKTTGWEFPVSQLIYWVRALPAPLAPIQKESRDPQGQLLSLRQLDWDITYSNYLPTLFEQQDTSSAIAMPHKIVATRSGYRITLVVREWRLTQNTH